MYPNLLGQKESRKLSNQDMAGIIGVSRSAYEQKIRSGKFTPLECAAYCNYFNKPFDYLFITESELDELYSKKASNLPLHKNPAP